MYILYTNKSLTPFLDNASTLILDYSSTCSSYIYLSISGKPYLTINNLFYWLSYFVIRQTNFGWLIQISSSPIFIFYNYKK